MSLFCLAFQLEFNVYDAAQNFKICQKASLLLLEKRGKIPSKYTLKRYHQITKKTFPAEIEEYRSSKKHKEIIREK